MYIYRNEIPDGNLAFLRYDSYTFHTIPHVHREIELVYVLRGSVDVVVDGKSVTFTLHTDAETLGAALVAEKLVEGEESQYGLYIKKVNGMTADYEIDKSYWSISKDGKDLMTGADGEKITDGAHYALTRAK